MSMMSSTSVIFARYLRDGGEKFILHEAECARLAKRAARDILEPRRARGIVLHTAAARDERAAPSPAHEDALTFQIGVCTIHRVRVDGQRDGDFAHRRQLVAQLELAAGYRMKNLFSELHVHRDAAAAV
jgi:hypothetical protein